jgi:hypothetical protein
LDSRCDQNETFEPLSESPRGQARAMGGTIIVHTDAARSHTATISQQFVEENEMVRIPRLSQSSDRHALIFLSLVT